MSNYGSNKPMGCVHVCQGVTVSDNYNRQTNKPQINGVELTGNKKSAELSVLSNKASDYPELKLGAANSGSYLVVIPAEGEPSKVPIKDVMRGHFITADELPEDMEIGNYCFLKLED